MALFENYERRIDQITAVLNQYGIKDIEEAEKITKDAGLDVYDMVKGIQPICFENACWAYTVGAAIAIKKDCRKASEAAAAIGEGLQAFCIPGSVADHRKVGLGHGNLGKMLLEEETECFCFLAGHESFAAAEGAIGIASKANVVREKPLRVILNGLGKDAAQIISRINGFTHVETKMDYFTGEVKVIKETPYSDGVRASVRCYGADDVVEGVAIMHLENVGVSITGNSTNPTRFQHPVAGTQERMRPSGQEVLLRRFRRRHRPYSSPRQHGRRPRFLRYDRHPRSYAFRRPVRRFLLRSGTRRNDGSHRHGQQPHGRCHRCGRCFCRRSRESRQILILYFYTTGTKPLSGTPARGFCFIISEKMCEFFNSSIDALLFCLL